MPYPSIRSVSESDNQGESATILLPATINSGDLLVSCIWSWGSSTVGHIITPSGWSSIAAASNGTSARVISKIADGSEASTTVIVGNGVNTIGAISVSWAIADHSEIAEASLAVTGAITAANPVAIPDLTISGGVSRETLWLVASMCRVDSGSGNYTAGPSGWSGYGSVDASRDRAWVHKTSTGTSETGTPGFGWTDTASGIRSLGGKIAIPFSGSASSPLFFGSNF